LQARGGHWQLPYAHEIRAYFFFWCAKVGMYVSLLKLKNVPDSRSVAFVPSTFERAAKMPSIPVNSNQTLAKNAPVVQQKFSPLNLQSTTNQLVAPRSAADNPRKFSAS
jgi:hypothetical protein